MSICDEVAKLQQAAPPRTVEDQVKRHREVMAELERQGLKRPEPEGYKIPLDHRMAVACFRD